MLATISHILIQDHEQRNGDFHQLVYHRFFIMLFSDLNVPDPVFDGINIPVLHTFRLVDHLFQVKKFFMQFAKNV